MQPYRTGGVAPLLTMLNACAPGVSVVNIDNGFGAACMAIKILQMRDYKPTSTGSSQ
jgi:NCAIR mutase (PurE)-related protein